MVCLIAFCFFQVKSWHLVQLPKKLKLSILFSVCFFKYIFNRNEAISNEIYFKKINLYLLLVKKVNTTNFIV